MTGNQLFIGIDPGGSGGLCQVWNGLPHATAMPKTERDVWLWFEQVKRDCTSFQNYFAVVEKVGGFITGNPAPGSAMFKFGRNVGVIVGCLIASEIQFEEVTPQKWMKEFGLVRRKGEAKTAFKNRLKQVAQGLHPKGKVTLDTADSILIAEYCRRKHERVK